MGIISSSPGIGGAGFTPTPSNEVLVSTINDLPTPVAGDIQLADRTKYNFQQQSLVLNYNFISGVETYIIDATITTDKIFKSSNPNASLHILNSSVVYSGSTDALFEFTDFSLLRLYYTLVATTGGTDLFDLDSTNAGNFGGLVVINRATIAGLPSLYTSAIGTFRKALINISNLQVQGFKDGFKFINNKGVAIDLVRMDNGLNNLGAIMFDFSGTINAINLRSLSPQPKNNEKIFYFNPTLVYNDILVNDCAIKLIESGVTYSNVFSSGSIDQTDIGVTMTGNTHIPDSTVFSDISFLNNTEVTTISVINTPVSINATWSGNTERFVIEHLLDYDTQTTNFTVGQVLTQGSVTGTITADNDTGTSGTLTLENVSGGSFATAALITDALGGSANLVKTSARLRYISTQESRVFITPVVTLRPAIGVNIKLCVIIAKNGVPFLASEACDVISSISGNERTVTSHASDNFKDGDYIEVFVANATNTTDIEVINAMLISSK